MPNEKLQWETSNQLDIGIEAGLFKNRIYVSADFFDKRTRNLLYEQNLPNTTGFSKFWTNLGKVRFWGYELELTSRNIVKKNFSWESKLVLSYQQNKVSQTARQRDRKNRTGGIAWATALLRRHRRRRAHQPFLRLCSHGYHRDRRAGCQCQLRCPVASAPERRQTRRRL